MRKSKFHAAPLHQPVIAPIRAMSPDVAVTIAQRHLGAGQVAQAELVLRDARQAHPDAPAVNGLLAVLALFGNRPAEALELATRAVRHAPTDAALHFTLGRACKAAGELEAAVGAYERAVELDPRFAEARVSLGIALKNLGRVDEAIACHEAALRIDPNLAVAHANLAVARAAQREQRRDADRGVTDASGGLPGEAEFSALQRAVELEPNDPELHKNLATALMMAGRHLDAAQAFNRALTLDPSDAQCCARLGNCLIALGDHALAADAFQKWLKLNADHAPVMRSLAEALARLGEAEAALDWAMKAAALEPDATSEMHIAVALLQLRRLDEALARGRRAVEMAPDRTDLHPAMLLALNYRLDDPAPILEAHADYGRRLPTPPTPRPAWRAKAPGERLRVGYVSGDFVNHSVAFFASPLLRHHDTSRFEVVCYHNNAQTDQVTRRLKGLGHRWVECHALSDEALRRRILADQIDILVDLSGHTTHSRVGVFALGAAAVQIGYLGYPTVSGVPAMDHRMTDAVIDPDSGEPWPMASDRPLRLPGSMFCYEPAADAPEVASLPAAAHGHVTFGSFNNIAKLSDHTLALWADVMSAVPGSHLVLKAASMAQAANRDDITRFMAARGIAADRLRMMHRLPDTRSHLDAYALVDIALDTYPYNGATTTCEALWMGVPVVSRSGWTHTSRMGASMLSAIGRGEWVAPSDTAFVATAVRLAGDQQTLAAWRRTARGHLQSSALMDGPAFARGFESQLLHAWEARGAGNTAVQTQA